MNSDLLWNAIYTRPNCQKKVCALLEKKGINFYFPLGKSSTPSHLQKKQEPTSLFPSIIFVQSQPDGYLNTFARLCGLFNLLYHHKHPAVFPSSEIHAIQHFLAAHETVTVTKIALSIADMSGTSEQVINSNTTVKESVFMLSLPNLGYVLTSKEKTINTVRLVRQNQIRFKTSEKLAMMFGLKNGSGKFQ